MNSKPTYSAKIQVQLLCEALAAYGITDIVISPGSRNGALTLQFVNDHRFQCYSIVDERSAGYVALGMAQQTRKPVVICCTSGSAAANYLPAITEAFYQNLPLIVLTADRPLSYTDLFDGQTIRQEHLFDTHIYHSEQLTEDTSDSRLTETFVKIKNAVFSCLKNQGPVHLNMPFTEPLYEVVTEKLIEFEKISPPQITYDSVDYQQLKNLWSQSSKTLILVGLQPPNQSFQALLQQLSSQPQVVVFTETTSNAFHQQYVNTIDTAITGLSEQQLQDLQPTLLITLGQNVISKKIKQYLRKHKASMHWHVNPHWQPDTYFSLTHKIKVPETEFLAHAVENFEEVSSDYQKNWLQIRDEKLQKQTQFLQTAPYSDFKFWETFIPQIPADYIVHYGNSSIIRYAQLFHPKHTNPVYANRGTSGIDGSTSTAAGFAMKSEKPVLLVTGDIAAFYDSNGLWNSYIPSSFRVIVVNNGGGNIFKIIPGPANTRAIEFFETPHHRSLKLLAELNGFQYEKCSNLDEIHAKLSHFFQPSDKPKMLEIDTTQAPNAEILQQFLQISR
ncbi:MAG: 2-succinyl-5-enolpyruvyl-6-hydroxy-3-cyclohexene-1-carboxylic-acid synthase [Weeksellaceae bacterium]|nr:2-succinyl-5-enolpyruvyl-6-hydroxy-3-cyclohexene-1-carboxylic-acid synthase [Weeksellaceae bacterium]